MAKKKAFLTVIFILASSLAFGETTQNNLPLVLSFEEAAYTEFGFSAAPVDGLNDVTQFENDGYSLGELQEGFTSNAVVESSGTVYAYWNVVTATPITLSLSLKGPMYPQSMLNGFTPAEGATPVQWSVSWDGSEKLKSPDKVDFVQLTTIGGASSGSAEKSTSVIDSKALTIKASFSSSEAASMVADKYVGWVVLGIYPK